jgi:hypothetical protein
LLCCKGHEYEAVRAIEHLAVASLRNSGPRSCKGRRKREAMIRGTLRAGLAMMGRGEAGEAANAGVRKWS